MEIQLKKGLLDALVLAITRNDDVYGYKLLSEVTVLMEISESTLYPVLRRLESQGYLGTYNIEHNGRLRKYYKITNGGVERLGELKQSLQDVKEIIDAIFS